jgi:hypothetical protein
MDFSIVILKKILDTFIFSNFYVAMAAVAMCFASQRLFGLFFDKNLAIFVFSATMCSYTLHWFLTTSATKTLRILWTDQNRTFLKLLFVTSFFVTLFYFYFVAYLWKIIVPLALLTFFYTAPKIPFRFFYFLKGFAAAKTLYLATVWLSVTVILPFENANITWTSEFYFFAINRFLLIGTVCMLFDFRDRNEDFGIKNFITYFDEKKLNIAFFIATLCFAWSCFLLKNTFATFEIFALALPFSILVFTFFISKKTKNDYWFYVFLDGMTMVSSIVLLFQKV